MKETLSKNFGMSICILINKKCTPQCRTNTISTSGELTDSGTNIVTIFSKPMHHFSNTSLISMEESNLVIIAELISRNTSNSLKMQESSMIS